MLPIAGHIAPFYRAQVRLAETQINETAMQHDITILQHRLYCTAPITASHMSPGVLTGAVD